MKKRWITALSLACLAFLSWYFTQIFWQVSTQAFAKIKQELRHKPMTSAPSPACQAVSTHKEGKHGKSVQQKTILIIKRF